MSFAWGLCCVLVLAVLVGRLLARRDQDRERVRRESLTARASAGAVRRAAMPWRIRCHGGAEHVICQSCYLELAAGSYQLATALRAPHLGPAGERCSSCHRPFSSEPRR